MQAACLVGIGILLFASCAPAAPPAAGNLSASQKAAIGRKIWQNECAGSVAGLTTWNAGEEFPSLGIGHFIWYPAGFKGRFNETWPQFIAFAKQQGATPPAVALERHSPWNSKAEFQKDFNGPRLTSLRNWLAGNVACADGFHHRPVTCRLAEDPRRRAGQRKSARSRRTTRKSPPPRREPTRLIDYVNFKGEGTLATERYKGQGWGLLQVLGGMKDVPAGAPAAAEFAASAKRMLSRRIANSPPERGEKRWEEGWHNRCATYARPL